MGNVLELDDFSFDKKVLETDKVSLVDFWAPWCGPCKMLGPVVEEVAKDIGEKAFIGKLNVDDNPVVASKYKIMSIPTILIFKKGKIVDQFVGVQPKDLIIKRLESAINS
ncbi:MAG: thioredoxin [Patescibacteria group bacterium]|nr:thioredoxin [Patescibacteria group bacterium]